MAVIQENSSLRLFHVSEESGIARFDPRPSEFTDEPVVWAIDEDCMCNYLVPRECPRVTFYAGPETSPLDAAQYLCGSRAVVAIEPEWLDRVRRTRLYCYQMPAKTFTLLDACAGYYVSRDAVSPIAMEVIDDPLAELANRGVELRILEDLWPLRDSVVSSTLQYSAIRMRNARPRTAAGSTSSLSS